MRRTVLLLSFFSFIFTACGLQHVEDNEPAGQLSLTKANGSYGLSGCQVQAVLLFLNDNATTASAIKALGVTTRASNNLVAQRAVQAFSSLVDVDAVAWVGVKTIQRLGDSVPQECNQLPTNAYRLTDCQTDGLLDFVNDGNTDKAALKLAGASSRAADEILARRATQAITSLEDLDSVKWVGEATIYKMGSSFPAECQQTGGSVSADVVFTPAPSGQTHVSRIITLINGAQHSIDIALYNATPSRIKNALEGALARGVEVRMIFQKAQEDRKSSSLSGTKSGQFENMGVDVRYASKSKTMHHKFMIVDGPMGGHLDRAATGTLVTGSGNWNSGAEFSLDENTVFLSGSSELLVRYQVEFNRLWNYSWDFTLIAFAYQAAMPLTVDAVPDEPNVDAIFTTSNMKKNLSFTINSGSYLVAERLASEILAADTSVYIASGHMRSRHVYDALVALRASKPNVDIRVYLDSQEYTSTWYSNQQQADLNACIAGESTAEGQKECTYKTSMHFGYPLHQAGINTKFKYYAYRWDYTYAPQMHNKYLIIDGKKLITGSYNLSYNAELASMENMLIVSGPQFSQLVDSYTQSFLGLWNTDASGAKKAALEDKINNASTIPLVFPAMALDYDQITALKALLRANCADIDSEPFRTNPAAHQNCYR